LIQSPSCILRRALMRLPSTCSATPPPHPAGRSYSHPVPKHMLGHLPL
jgi:hypothetical protein